MKSILCTLLLITTISLCAQNTPRITQAVTMLEEYNDKAYQAIQHVVDCFRNNIPCAQQDITQARTINGLLGAALKIIELSPTPTPSKKTVFKRPISRT